MKFSNILSTAAAVLQLLGQTQAKAVFAHYMVLSKRVRFVYWNTDRNRKVGTVNQDHAQKDIDDAIAIG